MVTKKYLNRILLYAYIFYVIYTPSLIETAIINKYTVLAMLIPIIALPYIVRRDTSILKILFNRYVILFMSAVLIASVYLMIVQILNNVEINSFADYRLVQNNIINILVIHCAFIIDKLKKAGYSKEQALSLLLKIAAFQGLYSLASFAIPTLKEFSVMLYSVAGSSNQFVIDTRIFGISSDFTFGTPIYHGLLAGLALFMAMSKSKWKYLFYIPPILLVTFLNGRTGIVVFLLVAMLSILYSYGSVRYLKRLIFSFGLLAITLFGIMQFLQSQAPNAYAFIQSFIDDTVNLTDSNPTGNYSVLLSEIGRVPEGNELLFGTGIRAYEQSAVDAIGFRSDIGYTNDLFMGGLIFALMIYGALGAYLLSGVRDRRTFLIFSTLFAIILLVNIKGEIFRSSIFMFLIIYLKMIDTNMAGSGSEKK